MMYVHTLLVCMLLPLQRCIRLLAAQHIRKWFFLIIIFEDARAERLLPLLRLLVGLHCRNRLGCGAVLTLAGRLLSLLSLRLHI